MRYYVRGNIYKHGLVSDRVNEVFVLFWDHKKKKHHFITINHIKNYIEKVGLTTAVFGVPVVFECDEHEKEFLEFHPDAVDLRMEYRYGYWYPTVAVGVNEDKIPFEWRHGRWCWKKA